MSLFKNSKGITLIELLATLTISISLMGLLSTVLIQSFRSQEISDTHVNLRQEANYILSLLSSMHLRNDASTYDIIYERKSNSEWVLNIDNQTISNKDYDIYMMMEIGNDKTRFLLDPSSSNIERVTMDRKQTIKIKSLKLINNKNRDQSFEISTVISRLGGEG